MLTSCGVLIELQVFSRPADQRRTIGRSAQTDAGLLPDQRREFQRHFVEKDAIDPTDVRVSRVASRRATAVVVVLQREDEFDLPTARVEVVPSCVFQHRRRLRTKRTSNSNHAAKRTSLDNVRFEDSLGGKVTSTGNRSERIDIALLGVCVLQPCVLRDRDGSIAAGEGLQIGTLA